MLGLWLPIEPKTDAAGSGLAFEFLEDSSDGDAKRVLTGHDNGLITINIAEADDVHREKAARAAEGAVSHAFGAFPP